MWDQ
jgi:hypothetical protein